MSIETTANRINAIRQAMADPAAVISARNPLTGGAEALAPSTSTPSSAASSPFAAALTAAAASYQPAQGALGDSMSAMPGVSGYGYPGIAGPAGASTLASPLAGASPGARIVAAAESQLGESEQPPGSNESPAIAMYRGATAGAAAGEPWCAYFASWAARQAGEPIGAAGQGLGSVAEIWSWAQGSGRAIVNGPGVTPQPGDLIVFGDEHVGIVRDVLPSGQIQTIEGNFENKVAANVRSPGEATGYVNMS